MKRPTICFGPDACQHKKGCRLGRPLCRWMRAKRGKPCWCGAYKYPHRKGSALCGNPALIWAALDQPMRGGRAA
jgi:hypothetical protein